MLLEVWVEAVEAAEMLARLHVLHAHAPTAVALALVQVLDAKKLVHVLVDWLLVSPVTLSFLVVFRQLRDLLALADFLDDQLNIFLLHHFFVGHSNLVILRG